MSQALTATEPDGETQLACTSSAEFDIGDYIFIEDGGTIANSEWVHVGDVETGEVHITPGLGNGKDSSDTMHTEAIRFQGTYEIAGKWSQIRLVISTAGATGNNILVLGHVTILDAVA